MWPFVLCTCGRYMYECYCHFSGVKFSHKGIMDHEISPVSGLFRKGGYNRTMTDQLINCLFFQDSAVSLYAYGSPSLQHKLKGAKRFRSIFNPVMR